MSRNVLVILADEHSPRFMGCSGHEVVKTPNLDALAAAGTRFTNAYTPSPICVPARASLATGRWVHRLRNWGSAEPYRGAVRSWAHIARDAGYYTTSIGKLHYGSVDEDHGFDNEIIPMHVVDGIGWVQGLDRTPSATYAEASELAAGVGIGESSYVKYDRAIVEEAVRWIGKHKNDTTPWVLLVSLVSPHYPLTVPAEFWDLYDGADLTPEIAGVDPAHPQLESLAAYWNYHDYFDSQRALDGRRAYLGLTSFLDAQVGRVVSALEDAGAGDDTTVIYTSDHGDMAGNRGLWCKSYMYEDSVGIPMIVRGPDVPAGQTRSTPVGLVDVHPTVVELVGQSDPSSEGTSLVSIARNKDDPDRVTFSEYHDGGSTAGFFMIRTGNWKYVYFIDAHPQLFDLESDPDELVDLGTDPNFAVVRTELESTLREIVDPEAANAQAFADQAAVMERLGGIEGIRTSFRFNHTPTPS